MGTTGDCRGRRRAGFTMLELSIATAVFMVGLLTAFHSQIQAMNLLRTTRESNAAVTDLQACMEQVLTLPIDQIPEAGGLYESGKAVAAFTNLHLRNEQLLPTYPGMVAPVVPDPLTIRLTLTWTDWAGRPRTMALSSCKTR